MKDNISKDLVDEYFVISNISLNILNQQYVSAVLCGEFSEVVLKYLIRRYVKGSSDKTHNLVVLLSILNKKTNKRMSSKVHSITYKLSRKTINNLRSLNYTNFRYNEISERQLKALKEVFQVCQELYSCLICKPKKGI